MVSLKKYEESFCEVFDDFRFESELRSIRGVIEIPYSWKEHHIPRKGILIFKKEVHSISFDPFLSNLKNTNSCKLDWYSMYYCRNYPLEFETSVDNTRIISKALHDMEKELIDC